jgi:pimeloyl-ACP methyl ester carboxylesterase
MIISNATPAVREFIESDMSAAPPAVAMSAMNDMFSRYMNGQVPTLFDELEIPIMTVNADKWPVNLEANRRHMHSFDAIILPNTGHFLMMTRPGEFNPALREAIEQITSPQQDPK